MKKQRDALEELISENFLVFLLEKWKISSGEQLGEPYSFKERPYMLEIAKDNFWFQVIQKSAQCGISELEVAKAVFETVHEKRNVLYTFPASEQMQQFVDARARNAITTNEYLSNFVTGSLNLKKFSLNYHQIYFRGVQKRRQMISVDVSSLKLDEADEYEDGTVSTLEKRLGAAKEPRKTIFSTPTFHGIGTSLYYFGSEAVKEKGSDQRVWTIKCESCGRWNEDLIWTENVIDLNKNDEKFSYYEPNVVVICRFCKKLLNRLSSNAEWVAKVPSNSTHCHGYHISKLFSPVANLNQMYLDSQNPIKEQEFYNSDLGLPYEPKGSRITDEALNKCRGHHLLVKKTMLPSFCGVDIGNKIHAISAQWDDNGKIKVVNVSELDDWLDLPYYYKDMNCKSMVIDMNPDKEQAIDFQKKFDNVFLAYFSQHLERSPEQCSKNLDDYTVGIHRTLMMMVVSDMIYEKNIILPMDIKTVRDFYEHMKSPIKAKKEDIKGDWVTFYPKTKNPDHFYFAMLYLLISMQLRQRPAISRILRIVN